MYKILIVDDEDVICLGIKLMIEKLALSDITDIYTAFDVAEAKKIVLEKKPHIVLTDINLPGENGISFINWINVNNLNVRCIVISGYDEFDYVKSAFKLGVEDYILKPITRDELSNILQKTFDRLKSNSSIHLQNQKYKQAILESRFHHSLDNANEAFNEADITLPYSKYLFVTVSFDFDETNYSILCDAINYTPYNLNAENAVTIGFWYNDLYVIVINMENEKDVFHIKSNIQKELDEIVKRLAIKMRYIIRPLQNDINVLKENYNYAVSELITRIVVSDGFTTVTGTYNQLMIQFSKALRMGKISEASELLYTLFSFVKSNLDPDISDIYHQVCGVIEDIYSSKIVFKKLYIFDSTAEICNYLRKIINSKFYEYEISSDKTTIDLATKFIKDNYHKNINMSIVSNEVSVSYNYFSKLFKEKIGVNFSDYLTEIRMNVAMKLLNDPTNKVLEISSKVGYDNPKHFAHAFKTYFGTSPNNYRKK